MCFRSQIVSEGKLNTYLDPVDSIMLYVRGGGDDVLAVIARILPSVGGRALDISTGEFLTGEPTQTVGWHGFQQYRDQILRGS